MPGNNITKGTVNATSDTAKVVATLGVGTLKMSSDIESIDGQFPKEAVRQGRVKSAPYLIKGKDYVPMPVEKAATYQEVGKVSWYGNETLRQKGGHMTANGETFDPGKPCCTQALTATSLC